LNTVASGKQEFHSGSSHRKIYIF